MPLIRLQSTVTITGYNYDYVYVLLLLLLISSHLVCDTLNSRVDNDLSFCWIYVLNNIYL